MHIDDRTSSDGRMDERTGPAAEDDAPRAQTWAAFEERLAAVLGRMAARTCLVLATRDADDGPYYVQFAQGGRPGFRAEAVGNGFLPGPRALSPAQEEHLGRLGWQWPAGAGTAERNFTRQWPMRAPFRDIARLAVRTLREVYGIRRPADLVYRRFDEDGRPFAEPDLGIPAGMPRSGRPGPEAPLGPEDDLESLVERAVAGFLCVDHVVHDDDGDIPIRMEEALLFVRLLGGPSPAVRVFAPVLRGARATRDILVAVNAINCRLVYARVLWTGGDVIIAAEVPAAHATEELVALACAEVAALAESLGPDLRSRFGPGEAPEARPPLPN